MGISFCYKYASPAYPLKGTHTPQKTQKAPVIHLEANSWQGAAWRDFTALPKPLQKNLWQQRLHSPPQTSPEESVAAEGFSPGERMTTQRLFVFAAARSQEKKLWVSNVQHGDYS